MDEAHKLEIGARIKHLRERSPFKQQAVADRLGIGIRAYQNLERVGTVRYERCEELGEIFEADPRWIWDGHERGMVTPDPLGASVLDRIEAKLDTLSERVAALDARFRAADSRRRSPGSPRQSQADRREDGN